MPVRVHALGHQLFVPLYVTILGGAVLIGWDLVRGDRRARELRLATWPLAAFVAWEGLSLLWTSDVHAGGVELLAFYLPFSILALGLARLPWSEVWLRLLALELAVMGLVFAAVGFYQYDTRNIFENPKLHNSNAYAAFFRVNSVFWDPSVYGRFLVVAMLPMLVLVVRGRSTRAALGGLAVLVVLWLGLLISFSQSSFAALLAAVVIVAAVAWRWRAIVAVALAVLVLAGIAATEPKVRHSLVHHTSSGLNSATSGRYSLVANGIRIALAHPVGGVGVGGFHDAYIARVGKHAFSASHTTPVTVAAESGLVGLALLLALVAAVLRGRVPADRPELRRPRVVRLRARRRRDLRPLVLLQRLRGGSDDVGADRARRARGAPARRGAGAGAARGEQGGGAGVIDQWRRALVLAPHTDDGEFGCGGTMARLVEAGCEVRYVAFSIATRSLPEGFPPDTLAREVREATGELGIPEAQLTVHDFDVRTFPEHRQDILELLVGLWEEWQPEVVFQPSLHDIHQDHQTIAQEGLRAFKRTTILGYEIPWNNFDFSYQWYVPLEERHVERKVAALERYASQHHRRYANAEYVRNLARTHGINVNREYAEVFQVYRVIA